MATPVDLRVARFDALLENATLNHPLPTLVDLLELALSALPEGASDVALAHTYPASSGWHTDSLAKVAIALGARILRTLSMQILNTLCADLERALIGITPLAPLPDHALRAPLEVVLGLTPHLRRILDLPRAPGTVLAPTAFFGGSGAEPAAVRPKVVEFYIAAAEATLRLSLLGTRWDEAVAREAQGWLTEADGPTGRALVSDPFSAALRPTLWNLCLYHLVGVAQSPTSKHLVWTLFARSTLASFTVDRRCASLRTCRAGGHSMIEIGDSHDEGPGTWLPWKALLDPAVVHVLTTFPACVPTVARGASVLVPLALGPSDP